MGLLLIMYGCSFDHDLWLAFLFACAFDLRVRRPGSRTVSSAARHLGVGLLVNWLAVRAWWVL